MTNYNRGTNFTAKDSLVTGNPSKLVKGSEIDAELNSIAAAIATKEDSTSVTTKLAAKADLASPALTGTPTAPTAAVGTNTNQIATMAALVNQAFAANLPGQSASTAGKFAQSQGASGVVQWAYAGISSINSTVTTDTTLAGSYLYVPVAMTALGKSVTLPAATTLSVGGPQYVIDNTKGTYPAGIRDNTGTLIMAVAPGGEALVSLKDNSTAAGVWSVTGSNLEPGLITIDSTFSSTYASTVLAPFVALDNNTSIHFAALSSGFAAFVVDNTGKVLTTPVTVSSAAGVVPRTAFKVSSTSAIVFYSDGNAVILTVSGTSPSLSLSVGTPVSNGASGWLGEDFVGAPRIAQLSPTLYVMSYAVVQTAGALTVQAISVSGTTITMGATVNAPTASVVANSATTYALTATTALVLYLSGAGTPYTVNAVVVSVSGTNCTVGTPASGGQLGQTNPVSSCLLSATKALIYHNTNTGGTRVDIQAITITGTSVAFGASTNVETGLTGGYVDYTANSATRYNPHLFPLSANTALLWYLDSSGISRAVVLTESSGTVTKGTILYNSISGSSGTNAGVGMILPQGTSEFCSVFAEVAPANGYSLAVLPNKISGTSVTVGAGKALRNIAQTAAANISCSRLASGDYVIPPGGIAAGAINISPSKVIPVFRSNGDSVAYRGEISCPSISVVNNLAIGAMYNNAVSSNRVVLLGGISASGSNGVYALRLLNVEIAA